jgi:hypothetical protein
MARRSAPPNLGEYIPLHALRRTLADPDESTFSRFVREQIWASEKVAGNFNTLTSVGMFVGGIIAVRTWGDLMLPA